MRVWIVRAAVALAVMMAGGCRIEAVSDSLSGVFPCETADDCADDQFCVVGRCYVDEPPQLAVITPEVEEAFPIAAAETVPVVVTIGGSNLTLVDPGQDPDAEFGQGSVQVFLDEREVAVLTAGELETGVPITVEVPNAGGAHRIRAVARNSDGVIYDNDGAEARRFFWINDGLPHAGFVRPFPGDVFPLEATSIQIEVAALNFQFDRPNPLVTSLDPKGHAHVHYGASFPACAFDDLCERFYFGIIAPSDPGSVSSTTTVAKLPASAAGMANITAVLVRIDHLRWLYPDENGEPIFDDIPILRADIEPPAIPTAEAAEF